MTVFNPVAFGTRVPVRVTSLSVHPHLIILMCREADPAANAGEPQAYACLYRPDSEEAERAEDAKLDDTGVLVFTDDGGDGYWNYFPDGSPEAAPPARSAGNQV